MTLTETELERYSRQLVMAGWSGEAQERLGAASAIVIGAGALGVPAAAYLAGAGVGRIGIVDDDRIDLSNLHRQPLYFTPEVGQPKAENLAMKLGVLNPEVAVEPYPVRLDEGNAQAIVMGADVVVDCSDSFATRYAVNDACCAERVPLVEAGVLALSGLVMSVRPGASACYRCAFPVPPPEGSVPSCREAGILGAIAGAIGSLQALEAIKLLTGVGQPLLDRMLQLDGAALEPVVVGTARRPGCAACGGIA